MKSFGIFGWPRVVVIAAALGGLVAQGWAADQGNAPLALELPAPTLKGTPGDLPSGPEVEPLTGKPRPPFLAPKGVQNVAAGKAVISSIKPFTGELEQVTDGKKEADDQDAVEFKKGTQWVQVDLGAAYEIYATGFCHVECGSSKTGSHGGNVTVG